jgi:hypothetical protein
MRAPARRNSNRRADPRRFAYGAYFCSDGSTVLFDRRYQPMFRRDSTGRVSADDPARWVHGIVGRCWFYDDSCPPRRDPETRHRIDILLRRWEAAAAGEQIGPELLLPRDWILTLRVGGHRFTWPPLAA